MKTKILFAALLLLGGLDQLRAATNTLASGAFSVVSAAVASAAPGDTIILPPGTNTWTGTLQLSGITLQGSGSDRTVIVDESPAVGNGQALIQVSTTPSALSRITQLQIKVGVINKYPFQNYTGDIIVYGSSPRLRIDHCVFAWLTGKPIHIGSQVNGLIDHCSFLMKEMANAIIVDGDGFGDVSWSTPYQAGSSNALYMEDNYIFSAVNFCAVDISNGGRAVFRHNTLVGAYFNTHGAETSQRNRSARYVEVYANNFSWGGGQQYNNFYTMCDLRGGSAVIFSNTAVGYWSTASLNYYRATDNDTGFLPWFGATGLRGWDSNGPALLTGTASVTSNALVVAGANWTVNQWAGCTVYNPSSQLCGMVIANSANTMQFLTSRRAWLQITFTAGSPFELHKVYPMLDQPGMGQSDPLSGDSPTPVWLHETSDPMYVWGNSLSVMYQVPTTIPSRAGTLYPNIKEGRDYFNDVPKPGYSPFIYPHPFTLTDNTTNQPPVVPPTTNAPPTNSIFVDPPHNPQTKPYP